MTLKVDTIINVAGTGAPNIPDGVTIAGTALASVPQMQYVASGSEPSSPENGELWFNTSSNEFKMYVNGAWYKIDATPPPPPFLGDRGVFAEGVDASGNNPGLMDYVTISTTGNATNFGQLSLRNEFSEMAGCFGLSGDGSSRGVFAGGTLNDSAGTSNQTNDIEYITFATTGNGTTFGDLTQARYEGASVSSGTRGCFIGGASINTAQNIIDYITIATTGNATSFGALTVGSRARLAACSDGSRGVFAGGDSSSTATSNVIDYITIDTTGNATDFGDLNVATDEHAACANTTRGLFGGGHTSVYTNAISYITIQTTGNSADFGDLTVARFKLTAASGA